MAVSEEQTPAKLQLKPPKPNKKLVRYGGIATALYLSGLAIYVMACRDAVFAMTPNEAGDFLAGTFSPLAFGWLVLGFFQQGEELRNSADALWLQGQELQHSVEQQKDLVAVTREQLALEREARIASEAEAELLSRPRFIIRGLGSSGLRGGRRFEFKVTNVAAPCTHVQLKLAPDKIVSERPALSTNEDFTFSQVVSDSVEPTDREMTLSFVDARHRQCFDQFTLKSTKVGESITLEAPTSIMRHRPGHSEVVSN